MNLKNEKRQHADAPPRSIVKPALKTSSVPESVLQFLNETFAQTHHEERGPVSQRILNSLRKGGLDLCQSRSTALLPTSPLAVVKTVMAPCPHISPGPTGAYYLPKAALVRSMH